jgi:hypothetical protein
MRQECAALLYHRFIIDYLIYNLVIVFRGSYSSTVRSRKKKLTAMGMRCADHATPSIRKSWH